MVRSGLTKGACVAIALANVSALPASAIEIIPGSSPAEGLNDGLISKVVVYHRGATAVGPRGGVYHRGGTWAGRPGYGYGYRGGYGYHGGYGYGGYGYHPYTAPQRRLVRRHSAQRLSRPIVGSIATATECVTKSHHFLRQQHLRGPKSDKSLTPAISRRSEIPKVWLCTTKADTFSFS
jgi:hypothetical protein